MTELSGINNNNKQALFNDKTNETATWQGRFVRVVQEIHTAIYLSLIKLAEYCHIVKNHKNQPVKQIESYTQIESNTQRIEIAMAFHLIQSKRLNYMCAYRAKQQISLLKLDLETMILVIQEQKLPSQEEAKHIAILEALLNCLLRTDDRLDQDNPLPGSQVFDQMQNLLNKMTQSEQKINESKAAFKKKSMSRHLFLVLAKQFIGRVNAIQPMFTNPSSDTCISYIQRDEQKTRDAFKKLLLELPGC